MKKIAGRNEKSKLSIRKKQKTYKKLGSKLRVRNNKYGIAFRM